MRRGQYTLITFIIATFILLSLTGIVSDLITDKAEQIGKAQILTALSDRVTMMRSVLTQERQVGVDFTSIHLGFIGGWPRGSSKCGSIINDTASWLFKNVPYWYSNHTTQQFYFYDGVLYSESPNFKLFTFSDIRSGLYDFSVDPPYVFDGEIIATTSDLFGGQYLDLESGPHYVLFGTDVTNLCDYSLCPVGTSVLGDSLPSGVRLNRYIPADGEITIGFNSSGAINYPGSCVSNVCGSGIYSGKACQDDGDCRYYGHLNITVGANSYDICPGIPGIGIVKLDEDGNFIEQQCFRMWYNAGEAPTMCPANSVALTDYLVNIEDGEYVIIGVRDEASVCLNPAYGTAKATITGLGSTMIGTLGGNGAWGMIYQQGAGLLAENRVDYPSDPFCISSTTIFNEKGYESCFPDEDFLEAIHELFLNRYFRVMDQLALQQIRDLTSVEDFNLRNMAQIFYDADVLSIGDNTIFIAFYPLNLPFFKLVNEGLSRASYEGSPIVYDAFNSDFASFQGIGNQLVVNRTINNLINELISKHSAFNIFTGLDMRGSDYLEYEVQMNDSLNWYLNPVEDQGKFWRVTSINPDDVSLENFFGEGDNNFIVKPFCLYYIKEACQFLSDEAPFGMRQRDGSWSQYVTLAGVDGDFNDPSLFRLYKSFTSDYLSLYSAKYSDWDGTAISACQACHDVGRFNNPCANFTAGSSCFDCFEELTGKSYDDTVATVYDGDLNAFATAFGDGSSDECYGLVTDEVVPMIQDYLVYMLAFLEDDLNNMFTYGWRLDAQKLNVTNITFQGITSQGLQFSTSCFECQELNLADDCKFFNSSILIEDPLMHVFSTRGNALYRNLDGSIISGLGLNYNTCVVLDGYPYILYDDPDTGQPEVHMCSDIGDFMLSDNSEELIYLDFTLSNNGNTDEYVYLTTIIDAYANLRKDSSSDANYYRPTADAYFDKLPFELTFTRPIDTVNPCTLGPNHCSQIVLGEEPFDKNAIDYGGENDLESPPHYDVLAMNSYPEDGILLTAGSSIELSVPVALLSIFSLNDKAHIIRVCAHTDYNDEWYWPDNCVEYTVGVCTDGDLSPSCCTNEDFNGVWLQLSTYYGACCGDDSHIGTGLLYEKGHETTVPFSVGAPYPVSNELSIAAWVKTNTLGTAQYIVSNDRDCCFTTGGYSLRLDNNYLQFLASYDSIDRSIAVSESTLDTSWHFVVVTFNQGEVKFYIDGVLDKTVDDIGISSIGVPPYNLHVGVLAHAAPNWYPFTGLIDNVGVWNRVITYEEVLDLFKIGKVIHSFVAKDDFLANPSDFCYHGVPYHCPVKEGALIRPTIHVWNYQLNPASYLDYFCTGAIG